VVPHLRDQVGGQEAGQTEGILFVGLDGGGEDPLDLEGVGDDTACHQGGEEVVDGPGIGGGFEHDGVIWAQMSLGPSGEVVEGDALGFEQDLLEGIDGGDDGEVLVEVNAHKTAGGETDVRVHRSPLKGRVGHGLGAQAFNHRCGLGAGGTFPDESMRRGAT